MGVEYYIGDRQKKIFYDLGKGGWWALKQDLEAVQDPEYLANEILEEVFVRACYDTESWASMVTYVTEEVAPELYDLFGSSDPKDLFIVPDCVDDISYIKAKQYRCVGSRYGTKGTQEYDDLLQQLNRHLAPDYPRRWLPSPGDPKMDKY